MISGKTFIYVERQQTALNPVTHNNEDFIPLLQQEQSAAFICCIYSGADATCECSHRSGPG